MPCIRCGACAQVCPVRLLPQQLYWHARAKDFDRVQDYHLFDCIECGCCAYVCPSHIPLVQYYRFAKTAIWAQEREREKADLARRRHEFRLERLEREKQERAARHRSKRAALTPEQGGDKGTKKAAIQAAVQRARAKHAAGEGAQDGSPGARLSAPGTTDQPSEGQPPSGAGEP
jgi:electron transport complex protein RnfC